MIRTDRPLVVRQGIPVHAPDGLLQALSSRQQQSAQANRGWIARHPVWFGTIVGAAAGTAAAAAASGSEAAFVGFYGGAALGAVTGAIIAAVR
jgi:hypothetical protein